MCPTLVTIVIFVQDVESLKNFYLNTLKLEIVEESKPHWLLLRAGRCCIGLHKIADQYLGSGQEKFKFDNNTKIVFEIEEDLNEVRDQLVRRNVTIGEVKTFENYNYWLCDGEDPEGNVFQLRQRKSGETAIDQLRKTGGDPPV